MNATQEAFDLFKTLEIGTQLVALNGFDSELVAVVGEHGVNLFQSYGEGDMQSIFLTDDCFEQLIKILQERLNDC